VSTLSAKSAASLEGTVDGLNGIQTVVSKPEFVILTGSKRSAILAAKSKAGFTPRIVAIMESVALIAKTAT
jgi:hypothetical protein